LEDGFPIVFFDAMVVFERQYSSASLLHIPKKPPKTSSLTSLRAPFKEERQKHIEQNKLLQEAVDSFGMPRADGFQAMGEDGVLHPKCGKLRTL